MPGPGSSCSASTASTGFVLQRGPGHWGGGEGPFHVSACGAEHPVALREAADVLWPVGSVFLGGHLVGVRQGIAHNLQSKILSFLLQERANRNSFSCNVVANDMFSNTIVLRTYVLNYNVVENIMFSITFKLGTYVLNSVGSREQYVLNSD